jgi:hypothetical protein
VRFSMLAGARRIAEIDINPLHVERLIALDARSCSTCRSLTRTCRAFDPALPAPVRCNLDLARRVALSDPTDPPGGRAAAGQVPRGPDRGDRLLTLLRAPGPVRAHSARTPDARRVQRLRPRDGARRGGDRRAR